MKIIIQFVPALNNCSLLWFGLSHKNSSKTDCGANITNWKKCMLLQVTIQSTLFF